MVTWVHVLLTLVTWPDFVETFGRPGHNFTCFYSAVAADLVITRLDYAEITRTLLLRWGTRVTCHTLSRVTCHVSSLAIPVPVFTLAVCYLVFAYIHIYRDRPHQPPDKLTTVTFSRYLPPSIIHYVSAQRLKACI